MLKLSDISFEFSTNSTSNVITGFSGDDLNKELEILNFKVYPGVVLTQAQLKLPHNRMHLDGNPLELRFHSRFVDTRLVFVNFVAFDFASRIDRTVVGVINQPEAFSGAFSQSPSTGASVIYSKLANETWEIRQTGVVASLWFTVNAVSSINDKIGFSRLMFSLVS